MIARDQYRLESDPSRRHVRLWLVGDLDTCIIDTILHDVHGEVRRMEAAGCRTGSLLTLLDLRELNLQSKEIAVKIQTRVAESNHLWEKVAVLLPASALHGLQIKRISANDTHAFFKNEADADAWLFGE